MNKEAVVRYYYDNNATKLRSVIDGILTGFGGIYDKDDFYSLGNVVFVSALNSYVDGKMGFGTYFSRCYRNRVKTEMSRRNAQKRTADVSSLDDDESPIDVPDSLSIEDEILSKESTAFIYNSLTRVGKRIIDMRLQGVTDSDIKKELGLNNKAFDDEVRKAQIVVIKAIK